MRHQPTYILFAAICLVAAAVLWLSIIAEPTEDARTSKTWHSMPPATLTAEAIRPLPEQTFQDPRKVALGRELFHDPRLSHDDTLACASCHVLAMGGTDRVARSIGIGGAVSAVNAPTVFNSGFNFVQFWDGRAATLEDQIDGPIHDPGELGSNWAEILRKLRRDPDYMDAFEDIYRDGLHLDNVKDAIATYERSLVTPNARFDKFLRGDDDAIAEQEKIGYQRFSSLGCISCHQGLNVGGNMFQEFGVMGDYFADRGGITEADYGRYNVTGEDEDRYVFKVPSLRNVALTAPYFHDGSAQTLREAVRVMGQYQLGRNLQADEIASLVAFLNTLTGEFDGAWK